MINEKMRELGSKRSVIRELFEYGKQLALREGSENVFDFSLGNPSVEPPKELDDALASLISTADATKLHGYTSAEGDLGVRESIAEYITRTHGPEARAENIFMTAGAAAALTGVLNAVVREGEEVILLSPYFPEYRVFAEFAKAMVVEVATQTDTFRPDIDAIARAINEKTAAIIVNSPNNPTGAVYTEDDIRALAELLSSKSLEYGKPIYIIADEPYRELVYTSTSPFIPRFYNNTLVCYSFSKVLSIPGDRIGYVFVSPDATDSYGIMRAIAGALRALGFVCAPTFFQHLVAKCLGACADVCVYRENRDILVSHLRGLGFTVTDPDGAFYLFLKSPSGDGRELSETAKKYGVLIVPSEDFGCPGYARIAYCQKKSLIERALPQLEKIANDYRSRGLL